MPAKYEYILIVMARRRRKKLPSEPIDVMIHGMGHDGRGVGKTDAGKTVFVDMALPGEKVTMQYTYTRSQFDEGRAIAVLEAASERVEPECPHFGICGGCSMQHLAHEAQIEYKKSTLYELMAHQAEATDYEKLPTLQAEVWRYRRKARLGVKYVHKKETVLVGFREKRSSFITEISDCAILDQRVADLIEPLKALLTTLESRSTIPQIEVACGDEEVALVFRHLEPLPGSDLKALTEFAEQKAFHLYLQSGGPQTVVKITPDDGVHRLSYQLPEFDLKMQFHPMDFTQVNAELNKAMISRAMTLLAPEADETILDLFCGLGNFSLPIARSDAKVVAVEGDQQMVERGYENARLNNLDNVDFYAADLTQDFSEMSWGKEHFDKILIDPPRSGALEIVQKITQFNARKIVYVSCNPITLARDSKILLDAGYSLVSAGVMDMFPHTAHVESIALFEK